MVVKLLDFGISKSYDQEGVSLSMTQTGVVLGTPQYMSAEQARGLDDIDGRTDIWGVGVILYEMMAGSQPFEGTNYNSLLYAIMNEPPIPFAQQGLRVPGPLESVVLRCLHKQRGQRYASAKDLRVALESALAVLPATATALAIERVSGFIPLPRASSASMPDIVSKDIPTLPAPSGQRMSHPGTPVPPPPPLSRTLDPTRRTPAPLPDLVPVDLTAEAVDAGRTRRLAVAGGAVLLGAVLVGAFMAFRGPSEKAAPAAAPPPSAAVPSAASPPPAVASEPTPQAVPSASEAAATPAPVSKKGKRAGPVPAPPTAGKGGGRAVTKVDNAGF
jgi:serine/threonine-protein kinase